MNTQQKIDVMMGYLEGKRLQVISRSLMRDRSGAAIWHDWPSNREPEWDFGRVAYRIVPSVETWAVVSGNDIKIIGSKALCQNFLHSQPTEQNARLVHLKEVEDA